MTGFVRLWVLLTVLASIPFAVYAPNDHGMIANMAVVSVMIFLPMFVPTLVVAFLIG